jgi:hypothetical protein
MHTYVQTAQAISRLAFSGSCPASSIRAPTTNYELDRPGCDTRPLRRDMSFATGVDEVVPTRCVQHPRITRWHAGLMNSRTHQEQDQLAS